MMKKQYNYDSKDNRNVEYNYIIFWKQKGGS